MNPSALSSVPSVPSVVNPSASPAIDDDPDPRTLTRREEAFTLYCQGYRSPAIAGLLGISERTVRAWIAATLQASADDSRTRRDHQLRLAIESQRAIVKAAWHAYDRAARAERLTLEHLQNAIPLNVDDDDPPALDDVADPLSNSPSPRGRGGRGVRSVPRLPTVGARYLQIVMNAQREIARLSGLYHLPDSFYDPNAGRPMQIVITRHPNLPPDQMLAWVAFRAQWDADHPHDPVPPDDLVFPPDGAPHHDFTPDCDDLDNRDDLNLYDQRPGRTDDPDPYAREDTLAHLTASDSGEHHPKRGTAPSPDLCLPTATPTEPAAKTAIPHPTANSPSLDFSPPHPCAGSPSLDFSPPHPCAGSPSLDFSPPHPCAGSPSLDFSPPHPCAGSSEPRASDLEIAAETATSCSPSPPSDHLAPLPASPQSPSADAQTAIHPSLLPRFRHRGSRPIHPPLIRQGFGTP